MRFKPGPLGVHNWSRWIWLVSRSGTGLAADSPRRRHDMALPAYQPCLFRLSLRQVARTCRAVSTDLLREVELGVDGQPDLVILGLDFA